MKILITGGCGFVGFNISTYLKKNIPNLKIFSLDNLYRKGSKFNQKLLLKNKIKNFKIDINDFKKISKLPKFDLIIDCCAEAAVEISKTHMDRVFNTNLVGTYNILKKAKNDNSKIIFLSTSRVYSIKELQKIIKNKKELKDKINIKQLIDEKFDTLKPKSIYGYTKLASEMLIEEFAYAFKLKYIINRCGVIAGPHQFGKQDQGFVSLWVWHHIIKKNLKLIGYGGYGNQIRDIIHIDDLCEIIKLQIKKFNKINNMTFGVGGGKKCATSLNDLTLLCQKITKNKIYFTKIKKTSIYDIPYFVTNNSLIKKYYNWTPKKNIKEIVEDTYNWQIENKKEITKFL